MHPRLRLRARRIILERHRSIDMRILREERQVLARAVLALDGPVRRDNVDDGGGGGGGDMDESPVECRFMGEGATPNPSTLRIVEKSDGSSLAALRCLMLPPPQNAASRTGDGRKYGG